MRTAGSLRVNIRPRSTPGGHAPSVDVLFHSAADACGAAAVGILLTGMGSDGAHGLAAMRNAGAFTIAEHEASCVVYGMPRAAVAIGAAAAITPLDVIPAVLLNAIGRCAAAQI